MNNGRSNVTYDLGQSEANNKCNVSTERFERSVRSILLLSLAGERERRVAVSVEKKKIVISKAA